MSSIAKGFVPEGFSAADQALIGAASQGDEVAVARCLAEGSNPNAVDSAGLTALLIAGDNGHLNTVVALYLAGGNPAAKNARTGADLMTTAMSYSGGGDLNMMVLGIAMGIDPSGYRGRNGQQRDILEMSRLRAAVKSNYAELVVRTLEDHPDLPDEDIKTAKTQARRLKHSDIESVLSSFLARRSAEAALAEMSGPKL